MIKEYLDKFGEILLNPLVFIGLFGVIIFIIAKKNSLKTRWVLLALLAVVASFAEYRDEFVPDPPDLAQPLETIRSYGRPIAVVLLAILLSFSVFFEFGTQRIPDRLYIRRSLLALQLVIFAKNLMYGSTVSALLAFMIFFLVYYLFHSGSSRWIHSGQAMKYGIACFAGAIILFNLMGFYQNFIDPYPMFFQQNRYLGMTGNPQHAAVLLASGTPLFLFLIIEAKAPHIRIFLSVLLLWSLYYLILTGSRTGMLLALISFAIYLLGYRIASLKYVLPIMIVVAIIAYSNIDFTQSVDERTLDRYSNISNTRAVVFAAQVRQFFEHPLLGHQLRGDRLRFGENSYLAVAAALGIVGLIPLLWMIRGVYIMSLRLWRISQKVYKERHYYLTVVAGIIALMACAFLEAYLVGNLTWPLIMLLTYVCWGYFLLASYGSKREVEKEESVQYVNQ